MTCHGEGCCLAFGELSLSLLVHLVDIYRACTTSTRESMSLFLCLHRFHAVLFSVLRVIASLQKFLLCRFEQCSVVHHLHTLLCPSPHSPTHPPPSTPHFFSKYGRKHLCLLRDRFSPNLPLSQTFHIPCPQDITTRAIANVPEKQRREEQQQRNTRMEGQGAYGSPAYG